MQEIIPFAVVGSNTLLEVNGKRVRGRLYPWGVVEGTHHSTLALKCMQNSSVIYAVFYYTVENKDHCDFVKLRTMLIR